MLPESLITAFWARVDKRTLNACWPWKGSVSAVGYGQISTRAFGGKTRTLSAHRVAWEIAHGAPPGDKLVCHRCDFKLCTNGRHLFLGTHTDNTQDAITKGRRGKGSSKLTEAEVTVIRTLPGPQHLIAKAFGVSQMAISLVKQRKTWTHVE